MIQNVGSIVSQLRKERGLSQEKLGQGLADMAELSRVESGGGEGDRFLLEALFQRMGKSVDKLEMSVTDMECRMMILRALLMESFRDRDYEAVEEYLEEYRKLPGGDKPLHRQFVQEMRALRVYAVQGDREECIGLLADAMGMTCPDWRGRKPGDYLLCTQEIQVLMLLLAVLSERNVIHRDSALPDDAPADSVYAGAETAERKLWELLGYLEEHYMDREEMARVYPQCAWILGRVCIARSAWETAYEVCSRGTEVLARSGLLTVADGLLEIQEACMEKMGREEEARGTAGMREAFLFLYELAGSRKPEKDALYLPLVSGKQEILIERELLKDMRLARGWSQERLSEGICSWETLSRIERGRRRPHRKNLYRMYRKLGLDREKYYSFIQTDDFSLCEKVHESKMMWFRGDKDDSSALVEEIAKKLDLAMPVNRQFVETQRLWDAIRKGETAGKEAIQEAERILRITMKDYKGIVYRTPFRQECMLLNQIALCMRQDKRVEEAIALWEQILDKFEASEVAPEHHAVSQMLIYMNYPGALEVSGRLEKSRQEALKGIRLMLKCQRGDVAAVIMANLACVYEKLDTQRDAELCEKCLRNSFYLFKYYGIEKKCKVVESYYIKKYGKKLT